MDGFKTKEIDCFKVIVYYKDTPTKRHFYNEVIDFGFESGVFFWRTFSSFYKAEIKDLSFLSVLPVRK